MTIRLPAGWKGVLLAIVLTIAFVLIGFGVSLLLVALYLAATAADLAAAIETVQTPGGVAAR